MADHDPSDTYPGDLTPEQLADRLGWPAELVLERIADGRIGHSAAGWTVSTSSEMREEWARAHWCPECGDDRGRDRADEGETP